MPHGLEDNTAATALDFCFQADNDFTQSVWCDIPASGRLQIQVINSDGTTMTEITAAGVQSLVFRQGLNRVAFITQNGTVSAASTFFNQIRSQWVDCYPPGQNPFFQT